ncbi:MAG: hypothetical protein Q9212_003500 [Teloschistes hypoglaucus]
MARAGLSALDLDQPPFTYFFYPATAPFVRHVLTRLLHFTEDPTDYINGQIDIDCSNPVLCPASANASAAGKPTANSRLGTTKHLDTAPGNRRSALHLARLPLPARARETETLLLLHALRQHHRFPRRRKFQ